MNFASQLILGFVSAAGSLLLLYAAVNWQSTDPYRFGCVALLASAAAGFRVRIPGMASATLSANFLFILYGVLELSWPETVVLGSFLTLTQCLWHENRRPPLDRILFNSCNTALATTAAFFTARLDVLSAPLLGTPVRLAAAAGVFFLANNAPACWMVAKSSGRTFVATWKELYQWAFPYYLLGAAAALLASLAGRYAGWQTAVIFVPVVFLVYHSYSVYLGRLEDEKRHAEQIASLNLRTIEALAMAIEAKDNQRQDHLERVRLYAAGLASRMHLDAPEKEALSAAAILHDIGKLAIPDHILSKRTPLSEEEIERVKIHPEVGSEILKRAEFHYPVEPIVHCHHEHWDGTGYPQGLRGEAIPRGARILAVADFLEDTVARFETPLSAAAVQRVLSELNTESGTRFDPSVVAVCRDSFLELQAEVEKNARGWCPSLQTVVNPGRGKPAAGYVRGHETSQHKVDYLQSIASAREEVQTLFELAQDMGRSLSLEDTFAALERKIRQIAPHHAMVVYILRNQFLEPEYVLCEPGVSCHPATLEVGEGLSGWVVENRKPILNGQPALEIDSASRAANQQNGFEIFQSALSVPLEGVHGMVGVLTLFRYDADAFERDQMRLMMAVSSRIGLSIENALKYRQAENSATLDYLTGLPNARSLFQHLDAELARAQRNNTPLTILVCDLDGFKQVNDRFGHLAGNDVLRHVAAGLKPVCREYDFVARMGGDEFVIVLPGLLPDDTGAKITAFQAVAQNAGLQVCGMDVLAMSVGQASYPVDGTTSEQLLTYADSAMYKQKQENKLRLRMKASGWDNPYPPASIQ